MSSIEKWLEARRQMVELEPQSLVLDGVNGALTVSVGCRALYGGSESAVICVGSTPITLDQARHLAKWLQEITQ